jgi:transposase
MLFCPLTRSNGESDPGGQRMAKGAPLKLSEQEKETLLSWLRSGTTEHRMVERAKMILMAAEKQSNEIIAKQLKTRSARVSKWRTRFARQGIDGLGDAVRKGAPEQYDPATERRILATLDGPPPKGFSSWTGSLVAHRLGDVSKHQVWRVLKRHGIHLQRRQSWCISTDPQFAPKASDIVGLYLNPPENAVVLCIDEKPGIQALERAQGWLRLPNGKALTGYNHEYVRHGTTTLFAALEVTTGLVQAGHFQRRRRREFLAFMNEVVGSYPGKEIHVILDNLRTHKPKRDRWLGRHKNIHFHYTPTHASWLNQIEIWFSILTRRALRGGSFVSPRQVREAIDQFIAAHNDNAAPFEWRKVEIFPKGLKKSYANFCN